MSDPNATDPSLGDRVDSGVEQLRTEVNARIDTLQQRIEELSAKVDGIQGQGQAQTQPTP